MSENKNNTPGCNCCQDDHEAVIHNLRELVRNLDSCCNNRGTIIKNQKGEIDKLRESNCALHEENDKLKRKNEVIRGMQSKIAKQSNEIKQLTEELSIAKSLFHKRYMDALDQAGKNAEDNFERGKVKGMEEIWKALLGAYKDRSVGENENIFGYPTVGEILYNLSPTWFMKKHHEHEEKEAHDIKIGDEVVVISPMGSDDSDYGIVYNIIEQTNGSKSYHVIGSGNCMAFGDRAITDGSVRKTGKHYGYVPFDYIA